MEDDLRPSVQGAATLALSRIPGETSLRALVQALGRDDRDEVDFVRSALKLTGARARDPLVRCLSGQPSLALADGCVLALGDSRAPGAYLAVTDALRRGITSPQAALASLGELGDPRALSTVLEHLFATDPLVRSTAIDAARRLLDPARPDGRAVEPIARALDAARNRRRERAALTALLGRTGSSRASEILGPLAWDSDHRALPVPAIRSLGLRGPAGQYRALLPPLTDEDAPIRF
jgi:HEAT repeat protein